MLFKNVEMIQKEIVAKRDDISDIVIISGTARGADKLGEYYAERTNLKKRFPADWDNLGKRAGYVRNAEMAKYAAKEVGVLIAFWDGISRGTKHMIDLANRYELEVHVVNFEKR
ncbi:MAG: SLOG family protein [Clostridiales bacterium]|nr:SLOG family protein [Clostridiales bacterium]